MVILRGISVCLGLLVVVTPVFSQDLPELKISEPIVVTTVGRNLDAFQVEMGLSRAKIGSEYMADISLIDSENSLFSTLLIVVGASVKGFGEAGVSLSDEQERAVELVNSAKAAGLSVVVSHVGGIQRRDTMTDQLLQTAVPLADMLIISDTSDDDGFLSNLNSGGAPIVSFSGSLITSFPKVVQGLME